MATTSDTTTAPAATVDPAAELLDQIKQLIPGAFPDGELDTTALLEALGKGSDSGARFAFTWPGIEAARLEARRPTTATLVPDHDASLNWDDARDVLIEGDNLQVLKLLKNGYTNQVKLIYIDPPYNTDETFTYNDSFAIPEAEYLALTGQVDEQGNVTTSKIENAGRKHAPWLTMMFSRLAVARQLLRRDGAILVSIDNNEVHHVRLLLDAIFGAHNFIDMMTWQGGRKGDAKLTAGGQDYILVYARDREFLRELDTRWRERKTGLEEVYAKEAELIEKHKPDWESAKKDLREWYDALPEGNLAKQHSHYSFIDEGGVWTSDNSSSPNYRANLIYDFKGYPPPENGWRYEQSTMDELDAAGKLIYPTGRATRIRIKKYLHEQEYWAPPSTFYRDRSGASSALDSLMGTKVFDDPKSVDVLARLVEGITTSDDLILDFFAGSGSTGHAVWEHTARERDERRWILVQAPEIPDDKVESGKNAIEAGYETIFEITAERLRRAAHALMEKHPASPKLGFRIFRTAPTHLVMGEPIVATDGMSGEQYITKALFNVQQAPVVDGADPLALAWELVIKSTATQLDARVHEHLIEGVTVYEFLPASADQDQSTGRLLVSLDTFSLSTADALGLTDNDTLILRSDKVDDNTTLTLAPRLQSKLVLLERVPREVSV